MIKKIMLVLSAVFIISTFAGAGYIFLHRGRLICLLPEQKPKKKAEKRTVLHRHCL